MRNITFTQGMQGSYKFMYEALVFYRPEKAEERSLGRALDAFERVGIYDTLELNGSTVPFYRVENSGMVQLEEAEYELLKKAVEATNPNGLFVRVKLGIMDALIGAPKAPEVA